MGMLHRIGLPTTAAAIAIMSVIPAMAADLPATLYKAPPEPEYSWTGWYLGANGGYGIGSGSGSLSYGYPKVAGFIFSPAGGAPPRSQPTILFNNMPAGGFFGGQAGYNYQLGRWVIGPRPTFRAQELPTPGRACPAVPASPQTCSSRSSIGSGRRAPVSASPMVRS